jgi:hypothetical protein
VNSNTQILYTIRNISSEDVAFVIKSIKFSAEKFYTKILKMDRNVFLTTMQEEMEKRLQNKEIKCLIFCNTEDTSQILGFILFQDTSPKIVHYLYVKEVFRKQNLAKEMLTQIGIKVKKELFIYTLKTFKAVEKEDKYLAVFNPFYF